jgi:hypothetical protein
MSTLVTEHDVFAESVRFSDDSMIVHLDDGRELSVPIAWYPRLLNGTKQEREKHELIGDGEGIHWPDLDEDISVEGLLAGKRSAETDSSLARWLEKRKPSTIRPSAFSFDDAWTWLSSKSPIRLKTATRKPLVATVTANSIQFTSPGDQMRPISKARLQRWYRLWFVEGRRENKYFRNESGDESEAKNIRLVRPLFDLIARK